MPHRIPLRTANQEFSRLIKDVENGEAFIITRRGKPIARLEPHAVDKMDDPDWRAAYEAMVKEMGTGVALGGLRIDRDDLYDR